MECRIFQIYVWVLTALLSSQLHAAPAVSQTPPPVPTPPPALAPSPQLIIRKDTPEKELPFWKTKADVRRRMREGRDIIVSVKDSEIKNAGKKKIRFEILGAGVVKRSKETAFKIAQDYPRLKDVSSHFKKVEADPKTSQVFIITEALGWQARMLLQMTPVSENWRNELQYEVVWGHFRGMKGFIGFEKIDEGRTEVSIQSLYEADSLPIPKILMGFALEVIAQKVAERMRTHLESATEPTPSAAVH